MASNKEKDLTAEADKLSLREIARKKMHHGKNHFQNPFSRKEYGNLWRILNWKLFRKNHFKKYYNQEKVREVRLRWDRVMEHRGSAITFMKHSCVMIKDGDKYLLVDPIFFGLIWFEDFSPIVSGLDEMPRPDHVLVTHGHYDHMDTASLKWLGDKAHYITPLGYDEIFKDLEIEKRTKLDWYDSYSDEKTEIILLPCDHWTMRNPITGPNRSLWGSFLIRGAGGYNTFIAGDAAYFDRYKEIGEEFNIDLAIFNLGAYEPRWFMAGSHLNPEETASAFLDLRAKNLMIVHWGAFRLGDEPVHFPPIHMKKEMERRGLLEKLVIINPGQTYFPESGEVL